MNSKKVEIYEVDTHAWGNDIYKMIYSTNHTQILIPLHIHLLTQYNIINPLNHYINIIF
jgi:hypothetical protein